MHKTGNPRRRWGKGEHKRLIRSLLRQEGHADIAFSINQGLNESSKGMAASSQRLKTLNLNTYKHHALGDVVETIQRYGTTDSYTTEAMSEVYGHILEH